MYQKTKTTKEWMNVKPHSKYNVTSLDDHRTLASGAIVDKIESIDGHPVDVK